MFQALNITGTGMEVHQLWMNAISDNIANINDVSPTSEKAFQARYVVAQSVEGGTQGVGAGVTTAGVQLGSAAGQLVYDPSNPLADGKGYVRHPDIDLGDQMSEMIMAQRGYQANTANFDRVRAAYQAAINMGK